MARSRKLEVVVAGDAKDLSRTFKKADQDAGKLEGRMHRMGGAFKLAGAAAAGALAVGLKQSIDAAVEAEKSQARLQAQLKASGISYREHASAIDEAIQKTSRLAGLDDEDLQDAFTAIVRSTGSVNTAMKDLTVVADLARAKHMDVAKAGELVAKVHAGNVGVLKRMGISITPVTAAQDKLKESTKKATAEQIRAAKEADKNATATKALGELQRRLGGQAAAYGKTAAGAQDRFRVAVENLQEKIGEKLLPVLAKVADKAAKFVDEMSRGTGAGGRFADKLKEIADRVRPIVKFFADHPRLIAVAVGAWAAYRVAAAAALTASRLKLIGMFAGLGPKAAAGGAVAGRAFGTAASTQAVGRFGGTPGKIGRARGWSTAGKIAGVAFGVAAAFEIARELSKTKFVNDIAQTIANVVTGTSPEENQRSIRESNAAIDRITERMRRDRANPPDIVIDDRPGGALDRQSRRPRRPSRRPRQPSGIGQNAPGGARAHTSRVRAHASRIVPVPGFPGEQADTSVLEEIAAIHRKYGLTLTDAYGKGHQSPGHTIYGTAADFAGPDSAMDAAVRDLVALGYKVLYDGRFGSIRWPGHGPSYVAGSNAHLHVELGTSGGLHGVKGGASSLGAVGGPVRRAPVPLTATLVGGGSLKSPPRGIRVTPKRMGGRLPKGFVPGVFTPAPRTNDPVGLAKNMRMFYVASRINQIKDAFARGAYKRPETIAERSQELNDLQTELGELTASGASLENIPGAAARLGALDKASALAELTPDKADDLDAARQTLAERKNILAFAQSHGFSDTDIAQAARDVKSAQDNVDSLDENTQASTQLADAIKNFADELKRQNDFNERVASVTGTQAVRAFADVISNELGPRMSLRALTPGVSARAAY